ncbi:MAG: cytoplasmic protein [Ignavibacteria bacterium RIFOXYC2_FULL_35_21]|nr:MAG: cytoplasmic protein [Ignavibacteria bacterium RIFOXYA2_FULL_35_10]OGV21274.1 MAG: cytoplasmic protein [Ignavibacteria bacterium RIFOXYC2_FULL_35_21]
MKKENKIISKDSIELLAEQISKLDSQFRSYAYKQVNSSLTIRNWIIGYYIYEFEQKGKDRAEYGEKLIPNLALRLKSKGHKGFSHTNLKLFRQFYLVYPRISQSLPDQFELAVISQSLPDQLQSKAIVQSPPGQFETDPHLLIDRLSFTHIIELLKADSPSKRNFYEAEAIKNNWPVRHLQRAMNSMLFERAGLSKNKTAVVKKFLEKEKILPENVIRNPYILEFLGLEEKPEYSENDLEQAITNHLQNFLIELGYGFCFEARQKRLTFDNTHYYIDLVFYHRILKCHVLIDLKLSEFTHADAGQMNVYLNYYKDNEMAEDDNEPIGIILCAGENEQLVKYATGGLSKKLFVSKYLINLPKEEELRKIIIEEQNKLR